MAPFFCAICGGGLEDQPPACPACGAPPALDGRWWLADKIGAGSFGTTWRAVGRAEQGRAQVVAIKEVPLARLDRKKRALLDREVAVLRALHHDCIPALRGYHLTGQGDGRRAWLVMDFVPGLTLRAEMKAQRHGLLEDLAILAGVADVLVYLHGLTPPVVHRDLKPENLIRHAETGRWWLVDFGSVRAEADGTFGGSTVAGTFDYMAPEQFAGDAPPATDLWALGVMGIELLSGRRPGSLRKGQHGYDWERHVQVSAEVRVLLGRLLEPEPERRGSARELLDELTRLLHVLPRDAHPPRTPIPAAPALRVEIPNLAVASHLAGKLAAMEEDRRRQEEAEARARAEAARLERERQDREARAQAEREAREARLAAEKQAREEEEARLRVEYERHVAEALIAARRQVEPQARAEWVAVVEFLRRATSDGHRWDDRARRDGLEAVRAWLQVYGALPPLRVGDRDHALDLALAAEVRAAAAWLAGDARDLRVEWPTDPAPGQRVEVFVGGGHMAFVTTRERIDFEEPYTARVPTRRFLGLPVAWRDEPRVREVTREVERIGLSCQGALAFRWCPPGSFRMGSPESDSEGQSDERPQHPVRLERGFWLGETPVTQGQYLALLGGENPSQFKGDQHPVERVNCADVARCCDALTTLLGGPVRLPREEEWEYACRAGSTKPRYGALDEIAWHSGNSGSTTHPVAQKQPNAWGLHDMLGNVWEWTASPWTSNHSNAADSVDPAASPAERGFADRVIRGGSWNSVPGGCRAAYRGRWDPTNRGWNRGFRVLRPPAAPGRR